MASVPLSSFSVLFKAIVQHSVLVDISAPRREAMAAEQSLCPCHGCIWQCSYIGGCVSAWEFRVCIRQKIRESIVAGLCQLYSQELEPLRIEAVSIHRRKGYRVSS